MRVALLSLFLVVLSFAAEARFGSGSNNFGWDQPQEFCTFNLEKKTSDFSNRYYVVEQFTRYGTFACFDAESECHNARARVPSWDYYDYRCQKAVVTRPDPIKSCEYRIEVGRRNNRHFRPGEYVGYGFGACRQAEDRCLDELDYLRRSGQVGRLAECVQTSGGDSRPRPPQPPRRVSATCTAELIAGRVGRPTGNLYTGSASARNYQEARQRACQEALNECSRHERGSLRCVVRN